jgi:hypothetical protein
MPTPSSPTRQYGLRERRADSRLACEGTASMDILSPKPRRGVPINVINIGPASLKLSVPFFLSPGSLVRIHMTESHANAEVRYCTREGSEYYVGVKVEDVIANPGAISD